MASKGQCQIGFLDLLLLFGAAGADLVIDLVHGRVLGVVLWVEQALNAAILCELLPLVNLLEDVIHGDGDLAARLRNHARVVKLGSTDNRSWTLERDERSTKVSGLTSSC